MSHFFCISCLRIILFSLILSFTQAKAANFSGDIFDDNSIESNSFASTEGLLSSIVANHVAVISGEFVDNATDCTLVGPEPLIWQRSYSSNPSVSIYGIEMGSLLPNETVRFGTRHSGWQFSHLTKLQFQVDFRKPKRHGQLSAFIPHAFFSQMLHRCKSSEKAYHHQDCEMPLIHQKGITNCSSGAISARTNPKNVIAKFLQDHKSCEVTFGTGNVRLYNGSLKDVGENGNICLWQFSPGHERKANGNQIVYSGNHIQAYNPAGTTLFSWLHVKRSKEEIKVLSSHFEPIIYRYAPFEVKNIHPNDFIKRYYLTSLTRPDQPDESYQYVRNARRDGWLLSRKDRQKNFLEIEYYGMGDQPGDYFKVNIEDHLDPRINRVKCLKAPVGHDETPIVTHQFFYDLSFKIDVKDKVTIYRGETTVLDAYGRKSVYAYNEYQRIKSLVQYFENAPYLATRYLWEDTKEVEGFFKVTEFDSPNQGNLMGKVLYDGNGKILSGRFFDYDEQGNILNESFFGNLTGNSQVLIQLDKAHRPIENGAESYKRSFTYDESNLLIEECDPNGRKTLYAYKPNTDLIVSKYFLDHEHICAREFYEYDENNVCINYISDNGTGFDEKDLTKVTERHITHYYPRQTMPVGVLERIDEMYLDLVTGQEQLIKRTLQTFSKEGRLLTKEICDAEGVSRYTLKWDYDAHGNIISEVNALGQTITRRFDDNDNLIFEMGPSQEYYIEHQYDFSNRCISTTKTNINGEIFVTTYSYDLVGNRIAEVDRYGNETKYKYDDLNRLIETIYPQVIENGTVIQPVIKTKYDCLGNCIEETDAGGYTTLKSYNARGKVTSILHPDGQLEQFEFSLNGNLAKKVSSNGTKIYFEVDSFGRLLSEKAYSSAEELLYKKCNTYDSLHKTSSTDAMGIKTFFKYDGAGRLIKTTQNDKIILYEYDALGRLAKKKEPYQDRMKVTCTEYDLLDRVVQERIEDREENILKKISFEYDSVGNRTHVIEEAQAGISQSITIYNSDKKPIKKIDPNGNETNFTYNYHCRNELGQFVLKTISTDPIGRRTIIICDALERPVHVKKRDAFGLILAKQDMTYDSQGNIAQIIDHVIEQGQEIRTIETAFNYQERGQLTCLTQAKDKPEQQITHIKYNQYGEKEKVTNANGTVLSFQYDALGRLDSYSSNDQSLSYHYSYREDNQIREVDDLIHGTKSIFEYDLKGRLLKEKLSNELAITYVYDLLDRVIALLLPDSSYIYYHYDEANLKQIERYKNHEPIYTYEYGAFDLSGLNLKSTTINNQEISYQYDLLKRPTAIAGSNYKITNTEYDIAGRLLSYDSDDPIGPLSNKYNYDDLNQLIQENSHVNQTYTCDSLHNRLTKNRLPSSFNDLHQLLNNGETAFSYDLSGNLISKQKDNEKTTYHYDANDRLITMEKDKKIHYLYDAFHRRMAKIEENKTTRYLYIGQDEIGAVDEEGHIQELRVLGQGNGAEIGASIAIELQDKIYSPSHDYRGNIVCLADLQGKVVESYRYSAFGEATIYNAEGEQVPTSMIGNPWLFSSKRLDSESGYVYFGRRYYDPENGRWITTDPAKLIDGTNLYAYLHHNPLHSFDLYGLQEEKEEPNYPLQNVEHHDDGQENQTEDAAPNEAPLGFVEKREGKKWKMYFCGFNQVAEIGISFVNGIMNGIMDSFNSGKTISDMVNGHYVTILYNESHGFLIDVIRSACELYFYADTPSVKALREKWYAYFANAGPNSVMLHFCHSEGVIITRNALRYFPEEYRQRMIIAAFCPAAYIDDKYALKVTHYRSKHDIVPLFDVAGAYRCRDSTVVLDPHPDAPWFDHPLDSPTYQESLMFEAKQYYRDYGGEKCVGF